ncbi:MAG: hypothetical protein L0241_14440 [Planctomycetia bacterium]|nr:hypothetical protein [Planctomycetia bacterium]
MATDGIAPPKPAGDQLASSEQFETAWNSAPTIADAATQLGITTRSAHLRAFFLRKCGVQLKSFPRGRRLLEPTPEPNPEPEQDQQPTSGVRLLPVAAEFVTTWNGAASVGEVASQLGITTLQASARAFYLRNCGVVLKKFRRGRKPRPKAERKPPPRKPRKTRRKLRPNAGQFVAIWNAADSVGEVAKQMRMTPHAARTMAWGYRREGLELKQFLEKNQGAKAAAFAAIWNASATIEEAAERMGKSPPAARSQADRIQSKGTSLKQLPSVVVIRLQETTEEFVALWNASQSPAEVASALGVGHQTVQNRASRLRKRGCVLKVFPPGQRPTNQQTAKRQ